MSRLEHLWTTLLAALALSTPLWAGADADRDDDPMLSGQLDAALEQAGMPALGVMRATSAGPQVLEVAGYRQDGSPVPVTRDDPWHLGSNTKAMSALLVARLAEQGRIDWSDSVADGLSDAIEDLHPDWQAVTWSHLLTHCSGLPANPSKLATLRLAGAGRDAAADRLTAAAGLLGKAPNDPPGVRFEYSNAGYVVAGAMLEAATGVSWEDLMREEIFEPLGLASAGFGAPGSAAAVDAPRGHRKALFGGLKSVEPGPWADNPPFLGPAGTVHMNLADYGRFLAEVLAGGQGEGKLLSREGHARLVQPGCAEDYAHGWGLGEGGVLTHAGSNTMWFARASLWPEEDRAIVVVSNDGRLEAQEAVFRELTDTLYAGHGQSPPH